MACMSSFARWCTRLPLGVALVALSACAEPTPAPDTGNLDQSVSDQGPRPDAGALPLDAGPLDLGDPDAGGYDADVQAGPFDAGPNPTALLRPVPGELTIIQVDLPIGVTVRLGEAAVVIGPAGSIALLDVGNSNHDDEMRALIETLNTQWLTPARGFPARQRLQVEWVILTHLHGDHAGAFEQLMTNDPLQVTQGVVHRGFVDLGDGMNTSDFEEVCSVLTGPSSGLDRPLCVSAQAAPCSYAALLSAHPALDCPGLFAGDLAEPADDALGLGAFIDLDGVRIELLGADGFMSDGTQAVPASPFAHEDNNQENARSLVGMIRFGDFRYHFGGDLTGAGEATEPDIESHFVNVSGAHAHGADGVDVIHAHHHARRTSSNTALVEHLTPADGKARNVVAGINAAHVGSPHAEVLEAFGARLSGGRFWVTQQAPGGADHPLLEVSDGDVLIQTISGGRGYWVQSSTLQAGGYPSVRGL